MIKPALSLFFNTTQHSYLDVIEVDFYQVGIIPLYSQQSFLYVSGVGLLIRDWLVLGTLDHTWGATQV